MVFTTQKNEIPSAMNFIKIFIADIFHRTFASFTSLSRGIAYYVYPVRIPPTKTITQTVSIQYNHYFSTFAWILETNNNGKSTRNHHWVLNSAILQNIKPKPKDIMKGKTALWSVTPFRLFHLFYSLSFIINYYEKTWINENMWHIVWYWNNNNKNSSIIYNKQHCRTVDYFPLNPIQFQFTFILRSMFIEYPHTFSYKIKKKTLKPNYLIIW